jgi:hypothetical protein
VPVDRVRAFPPRGTAARAARLGLCPLGLSARG